MRVGGVVASALLIGACASIAGLDPIDAPLERGDDGTSSGASGTSGGTSGDADGTSTSGSTSGQASSSGQGTSSSTSTGGVDSGPETGPPPLDENNPCTTDAECTQNATFKKCSSAGGGTCRERCVAKGSSFCDVLGLANPCCNGLACKTKETFPPTRCEDP